MDSLTVLWHSQSNFQLFSYVAFGFAAWWVFAGGRNKYLALALCFGAAVVAVYYYPPEGEIDGPRFPLLLLGILLVWNYLDNYNSYHETILDNYDHDIKETDKKRELQVATNYLYETQTRTHYLPEETQKKIKLDTLKLDSEIYSTETGHEVLKLDREEQALRQGVIEESKKTGLLPDVIIAVQTERELGRVKTEQKYEETIAVIGAGDILDTKDVQVIKKLTTDMIEQAELRQKAIDNPNMAPSVKELAVAQYTENIEHIKRQINERRGLVQAPNGQKTIGTGEGVADLGGLKEQGDEAPQVQVPAPRRRGRPRKNPAE